MDLGLAGWIAVFAVAATVIVAAGFLLARAGDTIAEETGLGRMTVGLLLLAFATSLPEIATDVSASLAGAPDLAVGDLFGSSMANMAILAIVDLVARRRVFSVAEMRQSRLATGAIMLTALAILGIVVASPLRLGWIGVETILVAGAYLAMVFWLQRAPAHIRGSGPAPGIPLAGAARGLEPHTRDWRRLRRAMAAFGAGAALVAVVAPVLAIAGKELAERAGIGQTFVGVALLAVTTSLPELAASLAAVRIGAVDLAVGNLFGSNAFNMSVLVLADAAYTPGPILGAVSSSQLVPGLGAILLTGLGLAAVLHGTEARVWRLEPDAILILVVYGLLLAATAGVLG